jgi:cholesterol transport system auxiliary component
MRGAALLFAAALLAGCAAQGPREPERYFILEAQPGAKASTAVELPPTLVSSFYDTQEIVYSRAPGTRGYYQFNRWTERPQRAIHAQLEARFPESQQPGRRVLTTHLDEIYHDAAERPGTVRIRLTAELSGPGSRSVAVRRVFAASAPAASYDAPGAVRGCNEALAALLNDIVAWVDAQERK